MKILLLNSWYYPNLKGGAEHSVKLLAENLAKSGKEVAIFTIDNDNRKLTKELINNVKIYRGSGGKYNIRKAYKRNKTIIESLRNKILEIYNPSIIKEIDFVINDFHPDIIHANCIAGISMTAIQYLQVKKIPIIYTLRDYFLDNPKNIIEKISWYNPLKKILLSIYRSYVKKRTKNIEAVTAPSSFTLNYYLKNGYFKNAKYREYIVNSIDINIDEIENNIKEKSNHIRRNFMYAGSLIEAKGIYPMIKAFMQTNFETSLYICGDGDLLNYVKLCSKRDNRIKVLGKLSPQQLADIYKKSDIMLVPSLWAEPFGRVVIEAARYGLFIIGSKNGGIPEIINEIECGIICDINNIEVLKKAMTDAFYGNFDTTYENIIKHIGKYNIDFQIESFNKIYNNLI